MVTTLIFVSVLATLVTTDTQPDPFDEKYGQFLRRFSQDGFVDYGAVKRDPARLDGLMALLADDANDDLSGNQLKARLINAYNIFVIKAVSDHYPIDSPLSVDGFFSELEFQLGSRRITLDELEKQVLFASFPDPRLHFALVCAAQGCPKLLGRPYSGQALDRTLTERTRLAVSSTILVKVDEDLERVYLSELFDWYSEDFSSDSTGVLDYINRYRTETVPTDFERATLRYDWRLNDKAVDNGRDL